MNLVEGGRKRAAMLCWQVSAVCIYVLMAAICEVGTSRATNDFSSVKALHVFNSSLLSEKCFWPLKSFGQPRNFIQTFFHFFFPSHNNVYMGNNVYKRCYKKSPNQTIFYALIWALFRASTQETRWREMWWLQFIKERKLPSQKTRVCLKETLTQYMHCNIISSSLFLFPSHSYLWEMAR